MVCNAGGGAHISPVLTLMVPAREVTSVLAASKASSCRLRLAWYACTSMRNHLSSEYEPVQPLSGVIRIVINLSQTSSPPWLWHLPGPSPQTG